MTTTTRNLDGPTVFGHPAGLYTLFFAEMWERFSYYGMRALLLFYMLKGFLGYNDDRAYAVYGAYTALVYMTPYFGGILADRLLGARRAVVLGGLFMAMGHLLMTVENKTAFFVALGMICCGNGFFKPNVSTMVGTLYPKASEKKDAGFTIFYMGINLGAAMSPIICGYVGETYGWHWGFGIATGGMLTGLAVFVLPNRVTQLILLGGVAIASISMLFLQDTLLQLSFRIFMGICLTTAGIIAFVALGRGGLPKWVGAPPDPARPGKKLGGIIRADVTVYLGCIVATGLFALVLQRNTVALAVLTITGIVALGYLLYEACFRCTKIARERLFVVIILIFFSMLFWAFFEQAGSSVTNFTDRNIDRVFEDDTVGAADVGTSITFRVALKADKAERDFPLLGQEQLGHKNADPAMKAAIVKEIRREQANKAKDLDGKALTKLDADYAALVSQIEKYEVLTMTGLTYLRNAVRKEEITDPTKTILWMFAAENVGMAYGGAEIPASEFVAINPIYILIFGLFFTAMWAFLGKRGLDPSPPVKFAFGLLQLGLGFGALWYGANQADDRGMVAMFYLFIGYLFHTTGELCLSPVGLSMITKLSPARMVGSVMGAWFLATAFSNYLAHFIAKLTSVDNGNGGDLQLVPPPSETVATYGEVFGIIAVTAMGAAVLCFMLSPILRKWMHSEVDESPLAVARVVDAKSRP